jgi:hypothetical protein
MKRWLTLTLATAGCSLMTSASASAQGTIGQYSQPQWQSRPALSPYLNMLRPGSNPALNYYGLVRPQMNTAQNLQNLQQQVQQLDSTVLNQGMSTGQPSAGSFLTTGHPVAFLNYGTFFPMYGRGGRGGGGGGLGGIPVGGGVGLGAGGVGGGLGAGGVGIGLGLGNLGGNNVNNRR